MNDSANDQDRKFNCSRRGRDGSLDVGASWPGTLLANRRTASGNPTQPVQADANSAAATLCWSNYPNTILRVGFPRGLQVKKLAGRAKQFLAWRGGRWLFDLEERGYRGLLTQVSGPISSLIGELPAKLY